MSTEGNRPVEALTRSERELRLLVDTIPALMWRAGPEGNIEYVNKCLLEYLGKPLGEIVGWGWMESVHPDDVAFKVSTWLKNLETDTPHDVVCRIRGAHGQYRWFEVRGEPLRASDGTVLSWYGVLIDIDDREKLQATLNVIPAHTWYAAPSGGLTFVNKRTADYLGLPKDHALRFGMSRLDDKHRAALATVIDSGPNPAVHGVVRWRIVDLCQWLWDEFRVSCRSLYFT